MVGLHDQEYTLSIPSAVDCGPSRVAVCKDGGAGSRPHGTRRLRSLDSHVSESLSYIPPLLFDGEDIPCALLGITHFLSNVQDGDGKHVGDQGRQVNYQVG